MRHSNFPEFERALRAKAQVTTKTAVEAVNRAALNVAYRASGFIPKVAQAEIAANLRANPRLLAALTSKHLKKTGATNLGKGGFKKEMAAYVAAVKKGARYLIVGFAPIVRDLGGKFRGGAVNSEGTSAITSYGIPATDANPSATLVWALREPNQRKREGAERVALKALEEAFAYVGNEMREYVRKKLSR